MPTDWTPTSWRSKPVAQDVVYPDADKLNSVCERLGALPGLVTPIEVERLRGELAEVAAGHAFLLQAGDCAELFSYCDPSQIEAKLKLVLVMSLIIIWGARTPVVRIGRIAGQYAKPRSKPTEMVNVGGEQKEILSFRGDNVNGFGINERIPDPERLMKAYFYSTATLNHLRASLASGFADLHAPMQWSFEHVRSPTLQSEFESIVDSLTDSLEFMRTIGADPTPASAAAGPLSSVDYYISHEGLMLEYEEALTRFAPLPASARTSSPLTSTVSTPASSMILPPAEDKAAYALSAHTIWLGDRTRQLDGAHVEFFRGIRNPIGIKVGPSMKAEELVEMLDTVNPNREPGRVTLICRYGAAKIDALLPAHIQAVQASPHRDAVVWCCDPMHGNTVTAPGDSGIKTRRFADIVTELVRALKIHASLGSRLGGAHLELTGEIDESGFSVTECLGGSMQLSAEDLAKRYRSHCDPRLNYEQSLDIAFVISSFLKAQRRKAGCAARRGPAAFSRDPSVQRDLSALAPSLDDTVPAEGRSQEDELLAELIQGIEARH